jgi:ABC-type phosphate transport system substrate-binding protein
MLSLALLATGLGDGAAGAVPPEKFRVIVNTSVPVATLRREEVARLFLKKTTEWPTGGKVRPIDLVATSPVRDAFSRTVLGKSAADVALLWQGLIFSGRDIPPPEKASQAEVVSYVRRNPGAIGYVAPDVPLVDGVKVVALSD